MANIKCLVCMKYCVPKGKVGQLKEMELDTADECESVKKQLPAIFLLRKLLEIPQEVCCKLLVEHGDPCLWADVCESHVVLVERARRVFDKIILLQAQFKKFQTEFKSAVTFSFETQENVASGSKIETSEIVRSYVSTDHANQERTLRKRVQAPLVDKGETGHKALEDEIVAKKPAGKKIPPKKPADKKTPPKKPANKKPGPKKPAKKKKADDDIVPFAGQGHKLSEASGSSNSGSQNLTDNIQSATINQPMNIQTAERKAAAAAALARLEKSKNPEADPAKHLAIRQRALIKELARKEVEQEKLLMEQKPSTSGSEDLSDFCDENIEIYPKSENGQNNATVIASADRFTCPTIGPEVLPKAEIERRIRKFLKKKLAEDTSCDIDISCLLIHSLNKQSKVGICVETLCKYLDNIIQNPKDMKFRKIRCGNKVYQERVADVEGINEFLSTAGFTKEKMKNEESDSMEEFWVFSPDEDEEEEDFVSYLSHCLEKLQETKPLKPVFDRNVQVLKSGTIDPRMQPELPPDFFDLSPEELKLEQQRKRDVVEQETTLRTKAQREKDRNKSHSGNCRYCLIRIKLPDGLILQGTFSCSDKILDLYDFVRENLSVDGDTAAFLLKKYGEGCLGNTDATLSESGLSPSAIVIFKPLSVPSSLATGEIPYLKSAIL